MPRWVCAPKYRLRNCSKCLSRSEMQSRRVGFGTAARVLRTINMNYGKRRPDHPPFLPPLPSSSSSSSSSSERSGSSEAHRGAAMHVRNCIRGYGFWHCSRREYITMHFCHIANVTSSFRPRANRIKYKSQNCPRQLVDRFDSMRESRIILDKKIDYVNSRKYIFVLCMCTWILIKL